MSQFTSALVVSPLSDGKSWVIQKEFKYHVGDIDSSDIITVHEGFTTDFTSVPRLFWFFIPGWGKYGNAAVIHDWLYWEQKRTRKEADDILLEGMNVLDVSTWQKVTIYNAVRYFGWFAWFRNAIEKKNGFNRVIETFLIKATMMSDRPAAFKSAYRYLSNKKFQTQNPKD